MIIPKGQTEEGQTIQWSKQMTNYDLQNITQKTKDSATRTSLSGSHRCGYDNVCLYFCTHILISHAAN